MKRSTENPRVIGSVRFSFGRFSDRHALGSDESQKSLVRAVQGLSNNVKVDSINIEGSELNIKSVDLICPTFHKFGQLCPWYHWIFQEIPNSVIVAYK